MHYSLFMKGFLMNQRALRIHSITSGEEFHLRNKVFPTFIVTVAKNYCWEKK